MHLTLSLRPMDPAAPAKSWMHPNDIVTRDEHGNRILNGLVYRFYDTHQDLLYIGQTTSNHVYPIRWPGHRKAPWWPLVAFYAVERVPGDTTTLLAIEKLAIQSEHPRFNKQHKRSRSSFTVFTHEGPESVIEQCRSRMSPEDFTALISAFKAEPDAP
jgi:hypothetical protein